MPSVTRTFLVALVVMALFSLAAFALDPQRGPDADAIRRWEEAALAAELAGDDRFFADNLHRDWTMGMGTGRFLSRRDRIRDVRDADPDTVLDVAIADLDVRVAGDAAVATYRKSYDARVRGAAVAVHLVVTDTFVRDRDRWLQLASHATEVDPAAE
jgi:hypothetical protein